MAERNLSRRLILDPSVADILSGMEERRSESQLPRRQREKRARERAKIQARRPQRVTYDLPAQLRGKVKELAEAEGVPASQIVTLALLRFLDAYSQGEIDLAIYKQPSRSPRYDWNLILAESPRKRK
jgi:hypothetical protein